MFPHCSLQLESLGADTRGGVSTDLGRGAVEVWLWPVDSINVL